MKAYIKMEKVLKFDNIKSQKFYHNKEPISIKKIDINKIVISNKISFGKEGFKYFIGCKDAKKIDVYVYFSQK